MPNVTPGKWNCVGGLLLTMTGWNGGEKANAIGMETPPDASGNPARLFMPPPPLPHTHKQHLQASLHLVSSPCRPILPTFPPLCVGPMVGYPHCTLTPAQQHLCWLPEQCELHYPLMPLMSHRRYCYQRGSRGKVVHSHRSKNSTCKLTGGIEAKPRNN